MVRKKLVLNACGVKSLGGVKLFVEAFELLVESGAEVIVLYSEEEFYNELKNQSLENELITFINENPVLLEQISMMALTTAIKDNEDSNLISINSNKKNSNISYKSFFNKISKSISANFKFTIFFE